MAVLSLWRDDEVTTTATVVTIDSHFSLRFRLAVVIHEHHYNLVCGSSHYRMVMAIITMLVVA
jgi:hypothetical protein